MCVCDRERERERETDREREREYRTSGRTFYKRNAGNTSTSEVPWDKQTSHFSWTACDGTGLGSNVPFFDDELPFLIITYKHYMKMYLFILGLFSDNINCID